MMTLPDRACQHDLPHKDNILRTMLLTSTIRIGDHNIAMSSIMPQTTDTMRLEDP